MTAARDALLERVVAEVAANGLRDRSLREIATAIGTSHRMLLYHFDSRDGLVAAVVVAVEQAQRDLLRELAASAQDAPSLVLALWARVSAPELRPFLRLFFETVASGAAPAGGADLTSPWLDASRDAAEQLGFDVDPLDVRVGVAVTRGLLIDVLESGQVGPATEALHRFVARYDLRGGA